MYKYMNDSIEKGLTPVTSKDLEQKFIDLGIKRGDIVLTDVSMSSMGYVIGGPESLYNALRKAFRSNSTFASEIWSQKPSVCKRGIRWTWKWVPASNKQSLQAMVTPSIANV